MYVKMIRRKNSIHFHDLRKIRKQIMEEAYIIKIKKMFGRLNENIGPVKRKHQQNFLQI